MPIVRLTFKDIEIENYDIKIYPPECPMSDIEDEDLVQLMGMLGFPEEEVRDGLIADKLAEENHQLKAELNEAIALLDESGRADKSYDTNYWERVAAFLRRHR